MSEWQKNAWVKPIRQDAVAIERLFQVVQRDLRVGRDPKGDPDWRFVAAYNAALQSATIALHACGYEATKGGGAHHTTIESLRLTIGDDGKAVDELQMFRAKRGGMIYEMIGIASESEIRDLCRLAVELRDRVRAWLEQNHPGLVKQEKKGKGRR